MIFSTLDPEAGRYSSLNPLRSFPPMPGILFPSQVPVTGDTMWPLTESLSSSSSTATIREPSNKNLRGYPCSECDRVFTHSSNLKTHMRIHSNVKPYTCSICDKTFRYSQNLTVHLRHHQGDKRFKCPECNSQFLTNSNLKSHMNTHHNPGTNIFMPNTPLLH